MLNVKPGTQDIPSPLEMPRNPEIAEVGTLRVRVQVSWFSSQYPILDRGQIYLDKPYRVKGIRPIKYSSHTAEACGLRRRISPGMNSTKRAVDRGIG